LDAAIVLPADSREDLDPEQYRAGVAEPQKLESAAEGSNAFRPRQELRARATIAKSTIWPTRTAEKAAALQDRFEQRLPRPWVFTQGKDSRQTFEPFLTIQCSTRQKTTTFPTHDGEDRSDYGGSRFHRFSRPPPR
jgi:hypothetical protein